MSLELLEGPGPVRALLRALDWSQTPLGAPGQWPHSLQAIVRVLLTSRFAMWMAWGPELTFLCNDAYLPTVGLKRDWVIGSRSDKVWAEIWPDIGPRIAHVLKTGEATWDEALRLYLQRSGFSEETYHTFSYSPLADDAGNTAGMLCVVAEVTQRVLGERQLALLRDLGVRLAAASTRAEVTAALEASLADEPRDLPFALVYLTEANGSVAELKAVHGLSRNEPLTPGRIDVHEPAAIWDFHSVWSDGTTLVDIPSEILNGLKLDHWQSPPNQALLTPLRQSDESQPAGYFIAGLNPHRALDDEYRGFLQLLTAQLAAAIARADEYESERKRAEALAEIDRAKTAFFSNVSHEFRAPLTLMLGPLEDALAIAESPEQRERLDLANRNALRLLRLVNALLDFSRIEAGRVQVSYRPTDLSTLTAELASSFRSATDRAGLTLNVDTPPLSQPVYVDRDMWETIVLNLLSNAFKFTHEGGITVELREATGFAVLTVHDTGTGIPETEMPKLFDRFHRVDGAKGRSIEGSGIGLALVRELVLRHGGEIAVESELGRGPAFTVTLPLGTAHLPPDRIAFDGADTPKAVRAQAFVEEALRWLPGDGALNAVLDIPVPTPSRRSDAGVRRHVLLVDDNADLRNYIVRLLTEQGYDVDTASDGEAALASLRISRPDLIITDVMMPRLDGFGLLRAVRENPKLYDLPVIMLSARAGEEATVEGLDAGADDYLTKPFSARELLARVSANIAMARVRREAAQSVRASEARFRGVFESGAIGFSIFDANTGETLAINDRLLAMTGHTRLDFKEGGWDWREFTPPEYLHLDTNAVEQARAQGSWVAFEKEYRRKDGKRIPVRVSSAPLPGEPGRVVVVVDDLTQIKAAERKLKELNQDLERRVMEALAEKRLLAEIIDRADVFVQVADRNFTWLAINKAAASEFAQIFGVPEPKTGDNMLAALDAKPEHRAAIEAVWSRALNGEEFI